MRFLSVASALGVVILAACSAPPIGDYPEEEFQRPKRRNADTSEDPDAAATAPPTTGTTSFTLTVTLAGPGAGTITSTPAGLTCQGKTCTGSFPSGTAVTLVPAPAAGSSFVGWTGACDGSTTCAPVMNGNVAITAELESLAGTWSGTYTNTRQAFDCTFENKGNLSITIAADGTAFTNTANVTGLELREIPSCNLVRTTTGTSPSEPVTLAGTATSGTWTVKVQGASGTLAFPYTGTFAGKKLSGSWTCATCVGSFTLTKQ